MIYIIDPNKDDNNNNNNNKITDALPYVKRQYVPLCQVKSCLRSTYPVNIT